MLAKSVKTNPVVIRRLIHDLIASGLVESIPGPKGGFRLGRPADEITLWDLYLATRDDEFFKQPKVNPNCIVSSNLKVLVHDAFGEAEIAMGESLKKTSIGDLTRDLARILGKDKAGEAIRKGM